MLHLWRQRYLGTPAGRSPPYRFVPGQSPHPTRDSKGHSYNVKPQQLMSFEAENWHSCEEYLYGIDLFNHGFWWEAHEALETVWVAAGGRYTETGAFIQGIIQITVAHLKWFQGLHDTATRMALKGLEKMQRINDIYLGIECDSFRSDVESYFSGKKRNTRQDQAPIEVKKTACIITLLDKLPQGRDMDWRERKHEDTYNEEEIKSRLNDDLPKWFYENGWIRRKYKTSGWKGTLMVVNTVGHLSEAAFHHPDLSVSYAFVIVKLKNHAAKGITNKDFELAKKIEEIVMWRPGLEGGALEGTPEDPRFKYLKYD